MTRITSPLTREVRREGRSVARVNGRTVNVSLLKELGRYWWTSTVNRNIYPCSIHVRIWACSTVLQMWTVPLKEYRQSYHKLLAVRRELDELRKAQADAERRTELLTYQAEEIDAAKLKPAKKMN